MEYLIRWNTEYIYFMYNILITKIKTKLSREIIKKLKLSSDKYEDKYQTLFNTETFE